MTLPYISGLTIGMDLKVIKQTYNQEKVIAELPIVGTNKTDLQDMGAAGKETHLIGYVFASGDAAQLLGWESSGTSLYYKSNRIELSGCLLSSLTLSENPSPDSFPFDFSFRLKEI